DSEWDLQWSSQNPLYGGPGVPPLDTRENWYLPAHAAVLLTGKPGGRIGGERHSSVGAKCSHTGQHSHGKGAQ
ncbi:MAG TPA: hypothetical protein VHY20_01945, partial [Pirellulales bacterium]|nr:hypothetical protein [Pirellulales bacterium]